MLAQRWRLPEKMDQPGLAPGAHHRALAALGRINRWSGSADLVWEPVGQFIRLAGMRQVTVLDVGSGGGDVMLACRDRARARAQGTELAITLLDQSAIALEHAAEQAAAGGFDVGRIIADALRVDLPSQFFDVITCTLMLHHLERADAVCLLRKMADAARCLLVVQDLRRCATGYGAAWLAARVVTRSPIVHWDGPVSVAGAFTIDEAGEMAREAGLDAARIVSRFPWRWVLVWQRYPVDGDAGA
jgi:2-polyprenyl-3-methyl-5-hydroxy-6-metoxy-1,4-benzoquinol methylase